MQNFNLVASKLTEEFEVTDGRIDKLHVAPLYVCENLP